MSLTTLSPNYEYELINIKTFLNSRTNGNYEKKDILTFYLMCQKLINYFKENKIQIPIYDSRNNTINELTIDHIIVSFNKQGARIPSFNSNGPTVPPHINIYSNYLTLLSDTERKLYDVIINPTTTNPNFNTLTTLSPTISTTSKKDEDDIIPYYLLVKERIYNKILKYISDNKLTDVITNKEVSSIIDENLVSANFNTTSDDTIIEIVKFLIKKKQPQQENNCNMNINIDVVNQKYKEIIDHYKKQYTNMKETEIIKTLYDKKKNELNTLDCISQAVFNVIIIPLIDKYSREDVINWKSYTYNNPKEKLDSQFITLEKQDMKQDEIDHPLDSLNSNMIKLTKSENVNYYDESKNDNCKRNEACWFNDRILKDKTQLDALAYYYPNRNIDVPTLNTESNQESEVYDEPDTSATSQIKQILEVLVNSQKNVLEKLQKINL